MTNSAQSTHELNRFETWLITGNQLKKSLIFAVMLFIVAIIIGVLSPDDSKNHAHHDSALTTTLAIGIPLLIIAGVVYLVIKKKLFSKVIADRDIYLEIDLDDADKIALRKWYKYGEVPSSKKLQPILGKYLDYQELIMTGERRPLGRNWQRSVLVLFVLGAIFRIIGYVLEGVKNHNAFIDGLNGVIVNVVLALFFIVITGSSPRLRSIQRKLAAPQLKRLARMREQLNQRA